MNVLIFEDEKYTATRLVQLLKSIDENIEVIAIVDSVKRGIEWFEKNEMPDLIFQDIILNDGNSFEIFDAVEVEAPVIFTTAFSEYAIRSFEVNSIDYIVKPYDKESIEQALLKLGKLKDAFNMPDKELLNEVLNKKEFTPKRRFLIKTGDSYTIIKSNDIAWFISEESVTTAKLFDGSNYIVDYTISELSKLMDIDHYLLINRKMIVNIESVEKIYSWFNSRLKLKLNPSVDSGDVIVSRERVKVFKEMLDR
jgi:DNA-binding LytR/AlgR family response regulator